jgi:hypothetical protein
MSRLLTHEETVYSGSTTVRLSFQSRTGHPDESNLAVDPDPPNYRNRRDPAARSRRLERQLTTHSGRFIANGKGPLRGNSFRPTLS